MAKVPKKSKTDSRSAMAADVRRQIAESTQEQLIAIEKHVPPADRWIASHPWMSMQKDEFVEKLTSDRWVGYARNAHAGCPSPAACNMLKMALMDPKTFWTSYNKSVQVALSRHEKSKLTHRKKMDKPEKIAEIREMLDTHLRARGLAREDWKPQPEFKSPAPTTAMVT